MTPAILIVSTLALASPLSASDTRTFTGVISDSMCRRDHESMKVDPVDKCVRECVQHSRKVRYVLLHGEHAYVLSDQETPAKYAGQEVKVTGVLYEKTGVIDVEKIEPAR
jgi:hypothetical protein